MCVCGAGHYPCRRPPGYFIAYVFIAAQNYAQLKTHDIIRMTDNILSADRAISVRFAVVDL